MDFELQSEITAIEVIAVGRGIRELERLQQRYGEGRWRKLKGVATVRLLDGSIHLAEIHWYEAHGIGRKEFKLKLPLLDCERRTMSGQTQPGHQFALCLDNAGYEASLEIGKLYRIVPDAEGDTHGYLRVVDESGEDYAYARERFFLPDLPSSVEEALLAATAGLAA